MMIKIFTVVYLEYPINSDTMMLKIFTWSKYLLMNLCSLSLYHHFSTLVLSSALAGCCVALLRLKVAADVSGRWWRMIASYSKFTATYSICTLYSILQHFTAFTAFYSIVQHFTVFTAFYSILPHFTAIYSICTFWQQFTVFVVLYSILQHFTAFVRTYLQLSEGS
jgi:hypothetical protein